MKLATLADGTRNGRLVVVSQDLTRCSDVRHLAATLPDALDDWERLAPQLELVARGIEAGGQPVERFHEREALAPLPFVSGSGDFLAPRAAIRLAGSDAGCDLAVEVAVITGPARMGADRATALAAIRLVTLLSGLQPAGGGRSAGVASMAPVAAAPAALGGAWDGTQLRAWLTVEANGRAAERRDAGDDVAPDFGELIVQAARDAALEAGAVVRSGRLRFRWPEQGEGAGLGAGDTVRVDMRDAAGRSLFGAIEHRLEPDLAR